MASAFPPRATDATFADELGTEIVTIFVGPERKKYAAHKNLLTSQSEYFDKALNGGFREAEENSIHLEEDDPAAIALLIGWLYRGVIPGPAVQSVHMQGAFPPSTIDTILPDGGTVEQVDIYTEQDPNQGFHTGGTLNYFHAITAHPKYTKYSPEELRLADYKDGRQFGEVEDEGPDMSSSGMRSFWRAAAPGWGVTTPRPEQSAFGNPQAGSLFGNTQGGGFGAPQVGGFGGPQGGGLFGNAQGGGLFGNPPPTGASLFGPSTVASSGGIFVNMSIPAGSQAAPGAGFSFPPANLSGQSWGNTSTATTAPTPTAPKSFGTQPVSTGSALSPTSTNLFGNSVAPSVQSGVLSNWPTTRTLPIPNTSTTPQAQVTASAATSPVDSQPNSSTSAPLIHRESSGVSSSTSTTIAEGSDQVATSHLTVQTNPSLLSAPRTQDGSLFVPTRATSSGVFGNGSSSSSTSQSAASNSLAPGSISTPICQLGTASAVNTTSNAQVPVASSTNALAEAVREALGVREDLNESSASSASSSSSPALDISSKGPAIHATSSPRISQNIQIAPTVAPINPFGLSARGTGVTFPWGPAPTLPFGLGPISQTQVPSQTSGLSTANPFQSRPSASSIWSPPPPSFNYHRFNDVTSRSPFDTTYSTYTTPSHQLALLNLTIFAETTCWTTLYNASIASFVAGERTLTRPPPLDHIALIYERTHDESSLRTWAVDSLATSKGDVDMSGYMSLLVDYEGFLEGVVKKVRERGQNDEQSPGFDGAGGLKYRMLEHNQKAAFKGKGKGKEKAFFRGGSFDMKDF